MSERAATQILETMPDAYTVVDREWRYKFVNRAAERLANLRREDMLGRKMTDLCPECVSTFESACRRAFTEGEIISFEEHTDLNTCFEHTVYPSGDHITICTREVTQRKKREEALRESEERFRRYFELGLFGMAITSPTQGILEVNDCICTMLGYERAELLQLTWAELTYPDDLAADVEKVNRCLAGEINAFSIDKRWIRKDGQILESTISVSCMRRADGSIDYFVALLQDTTERKRAEEALRRSEQRWRSLIENSSDIISILAPNGTVRYESPFVRETLGYEPTELIGRNALDLVHPEDAGRMRESVNRLLEPGDGLREGFSCRFRHKGGSWRILDGVSTRFTDQFGEVLVLLNSRDVTERERTEEALRISEERLRLLVESAEDYAIITFDTEGRISGWSSGAVRMFGYHESEITGRSSEILFSPEDREQGVPQEELKRAREEGSAVGERYYWRKDRTRVFASGVTRVLRNHNGLGYVKIARDLTDHKQADDALHRAHEVLEERVAERTKQLEALNKKLRLEITVRKRAQAGLRRSEMYLAEGQRLSHTGSVAWIFSTGEFVWSDETYRIYGLTPGAVKPTRELLLQLVHPDDRTWIKQTFDKVVLGTDDYDVKCRIVRPEGATRYVHSVGHRVFEAGELKEIVGTVIDITDRKEVEQQLIAGERRFRIFLESIPHHVWSFRTDGSVGYWNQRLIDYTGLNPEELQQGGWAALHPEDVERNRTAWREAWSNQRPYEMEQRLRGRDGRYRRFLCRAIPFQDGDERIEWFGTDTDIEDLRQTEEALRAVETELAHMSRVTTMGELAASIAHEVNQPLTAVITNGGASLRWLDPDKPNLLEATQALHRIIKDAKRAAEIINRVRTLIKRSPPEKVQLDINDLIRDTLVLVRGELPKPRIQLSTNLQDHLPAVLGDRIQLQQVVLNLVMNAIEATAMRLEGRREILVFSKRDGPDNILVGVQDSGVGIDDTLDQLFKPFFTTKVSGLGMGLSLSRSLIEAHGGHLRAMPNEERGATFLFSIPADMSMRRHVVSTE